ncbi:MAG: diguanylate cyclase [Armatimonadetes bacterium]|nr:diguanylate cyclase [Armatimonadota bacterium]
MFIRIPHRLRTTWTVFPSGSAFAAFAGTWFLTGRPPFGGWTVSTPVLSAVLIGLTGLLVFLGMRLLSGRRATGLLNRLAEVASQRADGDLEVSFPADEPGPLGDLAGVLNRAAEGETELRIDLTRRLEQAEMRARALDTFNLQMVESNAEVMGILHDLEWQNARLEDLKDRLEQLAFTDGLTGLNNHRTFQERFQAAFAHGRRYGQPLSLLMLDLDNFKELNDAHGHPTGDAVLVYAAMALQDVVRDSDFVSRYGGDEFAIVLPGTDITGALDLAERVRSDLERWEDAPSGFSVSVGVAELTPDIRDANDLLRAADDSLYEAKRRGRNRIAALQTEQVEERGA